MGEDRRRARDREEANKQCQAEAKPRRENARQEGPDTDTKKTHQDGVAKAKEPVGRNEIAREDLPERNGQDQRAVTKELPKGSCQGQENPQGERSCHLRPGTKKVHVIFEHRGKNHLIKKDIRCKDDAYTHLHTLIVNTDGTFNVLTYQAKLDSHEDAKPED